MTGTAFGPQGPNYSLTRPATDPAASNGADTWAKDCSAAGVNDGTYFTASWFNNIIGNLRALVRLAGVNLVDGDDYQITRAVRGGQLDYAADIGTSDALSSVISLAHTQMRAGMPFVVQKGKATNQTTTPTLTVTDSAGNTPITGTIVKANGQPVAPGDLPANAMLALRSDGANFRLLSLQLLSDFIGGLIQVVDTANASSSDSFLGTAVPPIAAYKPGQTFLVTATAAANKTPTPTLNVTGLAGTPLGALTLLRRDGTSLAAGDIPVNGEFLVTIDQAGRARLLSPTPTSDAAAAPAYYSPDTGAKNAIVVNSPAYGSTLQVGRPLQVKMGALNTVDGPTTINVNSIGLVPVKRPAGGSLVDLRIADLRGTQMMSFAYDGASFQLEGPLPGKSYSVFNQRYAAAGGQMVPSDMGSIVQMGVASNGPYTITLPPQAGTGNGETLTFYHNGSTSNVLQCAGSDKLAFPDGTLVSSIVMAIGDTMELTSIVSGNWIITGGSILNRYCRDFLLVKGSAVDYQKLPSGFIMQFGYGTTSSTSGSTALTLPTTFPSLGRSVTMMDSGGSAYPFGAAFSGTGAIQFWARNFSGALVSGETGFFTAIGY